ncbi:MAG: cation:proton antiporter [Gemmatimonadales bacterium]
MPTLSDTSFATTLALVGVVVLVAALLSGPIERWRFPQVALFLLLGLVLGPYALGLVDFRLDSSILQSIATLALVLVLFTDAVSVDVADVRRHRRLAFLVLGPGTALTAALIAAAAWALLDLPPAPAAILGAALASTDPVMMRGLLRGGDVPAPARQALALESGLNDIVLLPVVLVTMALLGAEGAEGAEGAGGAAPRLGRMALDLFVLGPGAGVVIGFVGVALLDGVRRRVPVRRDYESLYALGVAFTAYAAAEAVHGSGLLAAFAAGLTIAATDTELCDCFLDFGQAAAEMFLLFTFVALGSSLIWWGVSEVTWRSLAFAGAALAVRPVVLLAALARSKLDRRSRRLIVWYGPRGLSALLLVLLPIFVGLPGAEQLFPPTALVVLLSIVIHGGSLMLIGKREAGGGKRGPGVSTPDADEARGAVADRERISLEELRRLQAAGERVVLLDARKERAYREAETQAKGAIRLSPDANVAARAAELALPRHAWLVAYCA